MYLKRLTVLVLLLASWAFSFAQDVEFSVSAPNVVSVGEQFRVVFKLNARPQEMNPPAFDKFYILAGPSTSTSSSIQIVNGQMTQTYEFSYTYILEAVEEGQFTICSATARVSNKEYKTNPVEIEVVKGTTRQSAPSRAQQGEPAQPSSEQESSENIFVDIEFDRQTAYRGQPILATLSIYTRTNIAGFEEFKFPAFDGFWNQDVETPNNISFQRVNVNGRIYNMGVLKKYLLFPQRTGEIKIDPFELVVVAQRQGGRPQSVFDEFFGTYQNVRLRLKSNPKTLKIRDLPPNAPASFTGAVGNFNFEVSVDKSELKTNEAVNLKVRVAGSGNLRLIETPKIEFQSSIEVFDPNTSDRINTTSQGATGSKTFEFVAIPRGPGEFNLGKVSFTYFDPLKEQYKTLESKPIVLKVEADGSEDSGTPMVGFGREDIRFIGKDIRFIKTEGIKLRKGFPMLMGSSRYMLLLAVLVILFVAAFWWIQQRRKLLENISLVKTRRANKMARKRLVEAQKHLQLSNSERFHEELLKALWGYIADKLSIPVANLSSDSARATLLQHNVDEPDIEEFMRIIADCEFARYAPKGEHSQMRELYNSAITLISKLEEAIKK